MGFDDSIIIVNFNSGPHLARCLESVARQAPHARVLVIDNASRDGSEQAAERSTAPVVLVRNPSNVGFGRAVNQGLAQTAGEFVLLLNPDCQLEAGAVDQLEADSVAHPEAAISAPVIL